MQNSLYIESSLSLSTVNFSRAVPWRADVTMSSRVWQMLCQSFLIRPIYVQEKQILRTIKELDTLFRSYYLNSDFQRLNSKFAIDMWFMKPMLILKSHHNLKGLDWINPLQHKIRWFYSLAVEIEAYPTNHEFLDCKFWWEKESLIDEKNSDEKDDVSWPW